MRSIHTPPSKRGLASMPLLPSVAWEGSGTYSAYNTSMLTSAGTSSYFAARPCARLPVVALSAPCQQHQQYSPREIRSAGSTIPSSVNDEIFSAIQVKHTYLYRRMSLGNVVASAPFSSPVDTVFAQHLADLFGVGRSASSLEPAFTRRLLRTGRVQWSRWCSFPRRWACRCIDSCKLWHCKSVGFQLDLRFIVFRPWGEDTLV